MHTLPVKIKATIYCNDFGFSLRKAAKLCGVGKSSVHRWLRKPIDGARMRRKYPTPRQPKAVQVRECIKSHTTRNPYVTALDLACKVRDEIGVRVSASTTSRVRKALGFRYKLAARAQSGQRADPDHRFFQTPDVYEDAIAVDESSFVSCDRPRRGWAPGSQRVPKAPPRSRKRVSVLLAIDTHGTVAVDHRAGAYNTSTFCDFLRRLPTARRVILDNVSFHKSKVVRKVAAECGLELCFTPPYCPWFNPTEYAFSVSKHRYRMARLVGGSDFIGDALCSIERELDERRCTAFFRHAQSNVSHELSRIKKGA